VSTQHFCAYFFAGSNDLLSIDAKKLESVAQEIKEIGGDSLSVAGDVGADDFPKKIVDATVALV